jgi:hypothetical protein
VAISTIILIILLIFIGEKIGPVLLGAILVVLGIGIIKKPRFYSYKFDYNFDFTGYNIPLGIFMIVIGGMFIWTSLRKKKKEDQ